MNPLKILNPGHSISTDEPIDVIKQWIKDTPGRFKIIRSTSDKHTIVRIEGKNTIRKQVFSKCREMLPFEVAQFDYQVSYIRILVSKWNTENNDNIRVFENDGVAYVFKSFDPTKKYSTEVVERAKDGFEKWLEFQKSE